MQHDNNIENKLRQLEAMEQPDLSQMDNHWQQMQAMLQPGSLPMKKGWPKWMLNSLSVTAVVILIGAAILYVSSAKKNKAEVAVKQKEETVQNVNSNKTVNPQLFKDSIIETQTVYHKPTINASLIYDIENGDSKDWTEEDSILATVKLNVIPCATCPDKKEEAVLSNAERQLRLTNLFAQLQKQEQHFTIDNSRDTLLQFEEGTVLLIPANSFGGMNGVELTAKEFYKTSDIVLNQLNTASNKEQLETGGMLELKASYKGSQLSIDKQKPLKLFMADTSENMKDMQLFYGSDENKIINWKPQTQLFFRSQIITEVRVLNIIDQPIRIVETRKGSIGYFVIDEDSLKIDKDQLKELLQEKYGYHR